MAIWRVTISATFNGRIMQNQLHFNSNETVLTPQQIAGFIVSDWLPHIAPAQSHGIHYFEIETRQLHPANETAGQKVAISFDGNGSSDIHHACVAYKLLFRTGIIGRKFRGRYYIPASVQGFTTQDVVNNSGNTFFTQATQILTDKWCGGQAANPLHLVIYHRGPEASWTHVNQIQHSNVLGLQRRRNVGQGI